MSNAMKVLGITVAVTLACARFAAAESVEVINGDTLKYRGGLVHLWGVEAPDKGQTCADGWPAGEMAAKYLAGLIDRRNVVCDLVNAVPTKTAYAVCKADGQDLSSAMANGGMAWANLAQSPEYSVAETNAMSSIVGVHAHSCAKAEEWRASHGGKAASH